jgi:ABC-type transport system involved in cytochrome bd biosynthesis fused ATPase/permease subunit
LYDIFFREDSFQFGFNLDKQVALVGSSGCGKSTIIQLLEHFYDPSNGQLVSNRTQLQNHRRENCEAKKTTFGENKTQ